MVINKNHSHCSVKARPHGWEEETITKRSKKKHNKHIHIPMKENSGLGDFLVLIVLPFVTSKGFPVTSSGVLSFFCLCAKPALPYVSVVRYLLAALI